MKSRRTVEGMYGGVNITPLNLGNGEGVGSLRQIVFQNSSHDPVSTGIGAIALGGKRIDKLEAEGYQTAIASGNQSFAGGGSSHAQGNWSFAFGKDVKSYMGGSAAFNAARAGMTEEEFLVKNPSGVDNSGRSWDDNANSFAFAINEGKARGWGSFAGGTSETGINADAAFAFGNGSKAEGSTSTALNRSIARGKNSFAANLNYGDNYGANGEFSAVFNINNLSEGKGSFAANSYNQSLAENSTTFGLYNINKSPNSFICGKYSTEEGNLLFAVGGGDANTRKNIIFATQTRAAVSIRPAAGWDIIRLGDILDNQTYNNNRGTKGTKSYALLDGIFNKLTVGSEPTKDNDVLRWQEKVELENNITTESTARGQADSNLQGSINSVSSVLDEHKSNKSNPHVVTKSQVGLGSVQNYGQTSIPTSGSSLYFTAGGAFGLEARVNQSISDKIKDLKDSLFEETTSVSWYKSTSYGTGLRFYRPGVYRVRASYRYGSDVGVDVLLFSVSDLYEVEGDSQPTQNYSIRVLKNGSRVIATANRQGGGTSSLSGLQWIYLYQGMSGIAEVDSWTFEELNLESLGVE